MTIPTGPIPDVKPLFLDTSQVQPNGFHERLKTFLGVLQQREDNALKERELRNQELAKMEQAKAGELLGRMLSNLDTTQIPGMTLPAAPVPGMTTGAPVTMAPQTVEGPLARAVKSQPGSAIYEAMGRGGNVISQYFSDRDKRLLAAQKPAPKVDRQQLTDAQGYALAWDKSTNRADPILDSNGQPVRLKVPGEDGTGDTKWRLSGFKRNGVPLLYNDKGEFREAPGGADFYPTSTPPVEQYKAATLYAESAASWMNLKEMGFPTIPGDLLKFVAAARDAVGENGSFSTFLAQTQIYDEDTKAALNAYINLAMNALYQKSGAAISVKEMQQLINRFPFASDSQRNKAQKLRLFRTSMEAQYRTGADVLDRAEREHQIPYVKPYDLFNDLPGADPHTGQAFSPANPFAAPAPAPTQGQNAPPPLLQRPRR